MTEPWWTGAPTTPTTPQQQPPGIPPAVQGQNRQQGQNHPQPSQASPWMPPPTSPATSRASTTGATAPAPTMVGAPLQPKAPTSPAATGLGILIFLLVVATFAAGVWLFGPGALEWGVAIEPCLSGGGGWECIVNEDWRTSVLLPLVSMIAALCLARGAGIERRQGRLGYGFGYALLGFAALAAAWLVSTP